jgi:hypothetical protein
MNYFIVLFELLFLTLTCMLIGRRIINLFPIGMTRRIGFYIAPIMGLAFLILLATLYGWIVPFKFNYSIFIITAIIIISFIFEDKKSELYVDAAYLCLFTIICSLPVMAPIIRFNGYNPFTDIFTYLVQAQWLQEHAFFEKVITSGNYPSLTQVALYQASGSRMGGSFLLGFVQSIFNLKWSYYAYTATVSLGLVAGSLAMGGVVRNVIPLKRIPNLAISLLPIIMTNGFIYGAEWGFYPQTLGLSFALGICATFPYLTKIILSNKYSPLKITIYSLPVAICTAALLFAYNEPFPIFLIAVFVFLIIVGYSNLKQILALLGFISIYFAETLVLINYEAIRIFNNLYQTLTISSGNGDIGWPILWYPIQFLAFAFGLKVPFNHSHISFDFFYSTIFAAIVIIILIITLFNFVKTHHTRRDNIIFLICVEFVLILFFLKFRYFSISKSALEVGHTFLQFKISKYAAPFSMSLLGITTAIFWQHFKSHRKILIYAYLTLLTFGLWFHITASAKNLTNHFLNSVNNRSNPFGVLLDLRESIAYIPKDKTIYIDLGIEQSKLREMVAYILYDRKIASDYRDDGYIVGRLPDEDKNMPKNPEYPVLSMKTPTDISNSNTKIIGPFKIIWLP